MPVELVIDHSVIAEVSRTADSFAANMKIELECIHRSNLIGMGVLFLQFTGGTSAAGLGLNSEEPFDIFGLDAIVVDERATLRVLANSRELSITSLLDTSNERKHYRHGRDSFLRASPAGQDTEEHTIRCLAPQQAHHDCVRVHMAPGAPTPWMTSAGS